MVRHKNNDVAEGIILGQRQSLSYRQIVKQVKQMGYTVSVATVHRIHYEERVLFEIRCKKLGKLGFFLKNAPPRQ